MDRAEAMQLVRDALETLEQGTLPVPVRELWVYGDLALGLDPIDRLDLYVTKDVLLGGSPARADELADEYGVDGLGTTVHAEWAEAHPELIRANANGYADPAKCLAAQLVPPDASVHLEVCNAGFESNVRQRLEAAVDRDAYEQLLDPRAVCLWREGVTSEEAIEKLHESAFAFPPLGEAFEMLGLDEAEAVDAAESFRSWYDDLEGRSVRADVV